MKRHVYLKCLMRAREMETAAMRVAPELKHEMSPFIVAAHMVTLK